MQERANKDAIALRQLPRLKSLLNKYRQVKAKQASLLKLSELSSTVTAMSSFYRELSSVIKVLLTSDSFHIVLADHANNLSLAYCHNDTESHVLDQLSRNEWNYSLTALVYKQNKVFHCNAEDRHALAKQGQIHFYNSSCVDWLGVPLLRGQQVIGVLAIKSFADGMFFHEKDSQLLQFIAEHLVTAIDRVRSRELLEVSIQQRTEKLTEINANLQREIAERQKAVKIHKVLLNIAEISAKPQNMSDFYLALHKEVNRVLPAHNLSIALLSADKQWLDFPYHSDEKNPYVQARAFSNSFAELAIKKRKPILVKGSHVYRIDSKNELSAEPLNLTQLVKKNMPRTLLAAPLISQGEVFGVLAVQHYQDENVYNRSDLELIHFVSHHIAIAVWRNKTQTQIEQHNELLEKRINQRTKELQTTNRNLRMQIEERLKAEAQLYHEAHHDTLTKLPNRAMFADRLTYALRHIKRHPQRRFAVLFIDLDRFKMINDTLGHHAGDLFLIEIAARLKTCVRDNDILARLGGDEFVILLDSLQSQDDVEEVATRIIGAISLPFDLDGHTLYSNASIGIALCSNHYKDANEILRDADAAMYQAKNLGRGRYVFFDESMREQLLASMTLEQELRVAIEENQFELHYQQISDLQHDKIIGFEALLRWVHPSKGILTPSEFLFMAEETGLILDIETWVVEQVCRQFVTWHNSEYSNAFIGINLSGRHLTQANELTKLIKLIKQHTSEQHRLILEFNESAFGQHGDIALKALRRLHKFGVKLALDDYGVGQSSLNFLHDYPFEFIKLDRSFIGGLNSNHKHIELVKALTALGEQFGYRIVAEGIETQAMLAKLKNAGCEFGQGYHINRPAKLILQQQDIDDDDFLADVSA